MSTLVAELKRRNVIRVAVAYSVIGWLVLQVTHTLVSMLELPDATNKFILLLLIAAFIPMLLFSWVYELTPEGIKKEHDILPADSITAHTAKRLDMVTLLALLAVLSLGIWQQFNPTVLNANAQPGQLQLSSNNPALTPNIKPVIDENSIAILPFINMSSESSNEYFSDGMTEEILATLAKIKELKVVSRTSSFAYKGSTENLQVIGNRLGVNYILEGSVRKVDNMIRVTAQLIEVESSFHLWSETYDRELHDVFEIQDEIAKHIVQSLSLALSPESLVTEKNSATDTVAYDLYLQGRHFWYQRGEENLRKAITLYEEAVAIDPGFARAWAGLAVVTANLVAYTTIPIEELMPEAQSYAFRALALDPNQSEAVMVLPILMAYEKRWAETLKSLDRAVQLDPSNTTARIWKSETLWRMGYLDEAYKEIETAVALDPNSPPAIYNQAYYQLRMGNIEGALNLSEKVKDFNFKNAAYLQALIAIAQGNAQQSYKLLPKAFAILGLADEQSAIVVSGLENPAQRNAALEILDKLAIEIIEKRVSKFNVDIVLEIYKQFGELDRAFALANELADDGTAFIDYLFWGEQNKVARQHPQFKNIVRRRGLLEYWHLHGWPDECRPALSQIDCN